MILQEIILMSITHPVRERCRYVSNESLNDVSVEPCQDVSVVRSKTSLSNVVTVYHWYAFTTFQTSLGGTSPRRFRYTSPRCHTRSLTGTKLQHLKQISNETTNEVAVVGHHHVSELRCHEPLLIRLYDVLKLRCYDVELVGFIKLSNYRIYYSSILQTNTKVFWYQPEGKQEK